MEKYKIYVTFRFKEWKSHIIRQEVIDMLNNEVCSSDSKVVKSKGDPPDNESENNGVPPGNAIKDRKKLLHAQ